MDLIPVIDLKQGIVVHARRGERAHYAPLVTPFADSANPIAVIGGLRAAFGFSAFYVADLDAIGGDRGHHATIAAVLGKFSDLRLWVDGGFSAVPQLAPYLDDERIDLVLGSESIADERTYDALRSALPPSRCVLSLDRRGDAALGCAALFREPSRWPARVIHMTLTRVGAALGPDFDGLAELRARMPACALYAAGGIRDDDDLERLERLGVHGALVATALHEGRLSRATRSSD